MRKTIYEIASEILGKPEVSYDEAVRWGKPITDGLVPAGYDGQGEQLYALTRALVIGRHAGAIPGIEVVESRPVTFPARAQDCCDVLGGLYREARERGLVLLFQAVPGQVAVALHRSMGGCGCAVGVVVSKPGPRPAGVTHIINCACSDMLENSHEVAAFVQKVNPQAKVEVDGAIVSVTVDAPMRFEFSHIEWF